MRVFRSTMTFSHLCALILFVLCGVFGDTDEMKSVSVTEGDSVTLNTDVILQQDDHILWMFGPQESRIAEIHRQNIYIDVTNTIFDKRLQMDRQTGSLIIRNIRTEHTGLYKLQIIRMRGTSNKRFNVSVYALLPVPVITRDSSQSSSSETSSNKNCSLLCSVLNVSHVTLSWYKGNSLLSSISVSDLSISLSLPLEIECLDDSYSCVVAYSFTNQTKHLNITDLCQTCSNGPHVPFKGIIAAVFLLLLLLVISVLAVWIFCRRRSHKEAIQETRTTVEEVEYTDAIFTTNRAQDSETNGQNQTLEVSEYSEVVFR